MPITICGAAGGPCFRAQSVALNGGLLAELSPLAGTLIPWGPSAPEPLLRRSSNAWVAFGVGFQPDCCSRGSGGSGFALALRCAAIRFRGIRSACTESDVGELDIAQTGSAIPVKWQLFYPVLPRLGFNGGPVTNLNFPPLGYLSVFAVPGCAAGNVDDTTPNTIPIDTSTNRGPFFMAEEELCEDARACY